MVILSRFRVPFQVVTVPAIVMMAGTAFARSYLTIEQAQQVIFPGETFTPVSITLTPEERKMIQDKSGIPAGSKLQGIWRTSQGGYFIADEVLGKHDFITYAVGIDPDGSVRQVEIMDYRESQGSEVRQKKWRRQFVGKTGASELKLNADIRNISGATLSCRHVTEGVKRTLALYELVIKK